MTQSTILLINPLHGSGDLVARVLEEAGGFLVASSGSIAAAAETARRQPVDGVVLVVDAVEDKAIAAVADFVRLVVGTPLIAVGAAARGRLSEALKAQGAEAYLCLDDPAITALPDVLSSAIARHRLTVRCRKETERRTEMEGLLSAVLEVVRAETLIVSPDGKVITLNPAFSASFGWQIREAAGHPLANLLTETSPLAGRLKHKDGRVFPVAVRSAAVPVDSRSCRVISLELAGAALASAGDSNLDPAFAIRVTEMVRRGGGRLVAGRLQVVALDDVRLSLGERWERMAERIHDMAERILRLRLAPDDVFARNEAGQFIVCFAQLSEGEAWFKAQAIEKEIRQRLLGETSGGDLAGVTVETHAIELSEKDVAATQDFAAAIATKLAAETERMRKDAERFVAEVFASCDLHPRSVVSSNGKVADIEIAQFDSETQARIDQLAAMDEDWKVLAHIDALTLGSAGRHILHHLAGRGDRLLVVGLSFSTLYYRQHREALMGICRQLPPQVRQSLVLNVRGIPDNMLPARVSDLLNALRPFARHRMIKLERLDLGTLSLRDAMVSMVGIDASVLADAWERDPGSVQRFRTGLRRAGARLLVDGVMGRSGLAFTRQAGADLLAYRTEEVVRKSVAAE